MEFLEKIPDFLPPVPKRLFRKGKSRSVPDKRGLNIMDNQLFDDISINTDSKRYSTESNQSQVVSQATGDVIRNIQPTIQAQSKTIADLQMQLASLQGTVQKLTSELKQKNSISRKSISPQKTPERPPEKMFMKLPDRNFPRAPDRAFTRTPDRNFARTPDRGSTGTSDRNSTKTSDRSSTTTSVKTSEKQTMPIVTHTFVAKAAHLSQRPKSTPLAVHYSTIPSSKVVPANVQRKVEPLRPIPRRSVSMNKKPVRKELESIPETSPRTGMSRDIISPAISQQQLKDLFTGCIGSREELLQIEPNFEQIPPDFEWFAAEPSPEGQDIITALKYIQDILMAHHIPYHSWPQVAERLLSQDQRKAIKDMPSQWNKRLSWITFCQFVTQELDIYGILQDRINKFLTLVPHKQEELRLLITRLRFAIISAGLDPNSQQVRVRVHQLLRYYNVTGYSQELQYKTNKYLDRVRTEHPSLRPTVDLHLLPEPPATFVSYRKNPNVNTGMKP